MVTRTYEVRTYGCQMNVHDSERIAGLLDEAGYASVADGAQPDVVVFSTCAVRENADNKLDGNLGHLKPRSRTARPACHPSTASSSFADPLPPRCSPGVRCGWRLRSLSAPPRRSGPTHIRRCAMAALLIGYARCSTDQQDLTAQRDGLTSLGVEPGRIYVDHGLTGTNRERPGLREALAACREGDTLVVTKLDRLARSLPDARAIADELTARQVRLSLGGSVYDPNDAVGRLLFNVLAMVAEFESDLIRLRTKEGMRVAKAKGRLRGKQPKLNPRQEAHLVSLMAAGEHSTAELADLFGVGRSTVYRALGRSKHTIAV